MTMLDFTAMSATGTIGGSLANYGIWIVGLLTTYALSLWWQQPPSTIPFFHDRKPGEFSFMKAKIRFLTSGAEMLKECQSKVHDVRSTGD